MKHMKNMKNMERRSHLVLVLIMALSVLTSIVHADICQPNNSLTFDASELSVDQVAKKIFDHNLQHQKSDFETAIEIVNHCQNIVDDRISNIGFDISDKESAKSKMIRNRDIRGINEQIKQNQQNIIKIRGSMKKSLENIRYKGLFLAVIKYNSIFQSKQALLAIAESLITRDAIVELNGEFIEAISMAKNHELVKDEIKLVIQGQMDVDNVYLKKLIPGDRLFYYLSKVSVSPLKQGKQDKARADYQSQYEHLVMSASQGINTRTLQNFGLNENQIAEINSQIQTFTKTIKRENSRSRIKEKSAIEDASQKLNDINKTIIRLQGQIKKKRKEIKKSYREIGFQCNQIAENCIDRAIASINKDIKRLKQALITEKNKELKVNQSTVIPEGQPQKEIASMAISLVKQLQSSHEKVNKLLEQTVAVNYEIQSSESKQTLEINRQVDKYWVYLDPVGQVFKVMVVVKFKILQKSYRESEIYDRYQESSSGKTWTDPITGMEFVWINPGRFSMGSPSNEENRDSDESQHTVKITQGFWLGKYEITQGEWKKVMGSNPSKFKNCGKNCPVEQISWEDVQEYIKKMNRQGNGKFRLPTEAEWEYAARAGTSTPFSFGATIRPDQVNYDGNYPYGKAAKGKYRKKTVRVGSLPANAWGLHEMHGNVWEWVEDWYGDYPTGTVTNPRGPASGSFRVPRGGSWSNNAGYCRSACRSRISAVYP
ncbi:MAG: formylglycine-generating enzyme family protein, partial [Candidatus Brocadiales bacterium]|nr:formylglycine-generating enzyme family protein [Candidatus Brocadiales bacterium]